MASEVNKVELFFYKVLGAASVAGGALVTAGVFPGKFSVLFALFGTAAGFLHSLASNA